MDITEFYEISPDLNDAVLGTVFVHRQDGTRWELVSLPDENGDGAEFHKIGILSPGRTISVGWGTVYDAFKRVLPDSEVRSTSPWSTWSSLGHEFITRSSGDDSRELAYAGEDECLSCGARYELWRNDAESVHSYVYRKPDGSDPDYCPGVSSESDGDES